MTNWIDWQGGECPVAADAVVEVQFPDGGTASDHAFRLSWKHRRDSYANIVAYRVLPTFADLAAKDAEIARLAKCLFVVNEDNARLRAELAGARALLADEHTMRTIGRLPSKCQQPDCAYVGQTKPRMCSCHADAEQEHSRAVLAAIKGES